MNRVAFFDFDGTLTRGDTLLPFLRMVAGTPLYWRTILRLTPVLGKYAFRLIKNDVAKQLVLSAFLKGMQKQILLMQGSNFADYHIAALQRPEGMARLHWHRAQGHRCVLVSASLDVYLERWAASAGFDDAITSSLEYNADGLVSGMLQGANCFGEEKVRRISAWLSAHPASHTYAYGDSAGDLPMLNMVDEGYLWSNQVFTLVGPQRSRQ